MSENLYISKCWIKFIFFYYFMIFIAGNLIALTALSPNIFFKQDIEMLHRALIGGAGMACIGSSIFYIRKIYKSCMNLKFITDSSADCEIQRFGTVIYYLARPFFAIGFSILVVIGIKSGSMLTSKNAVDLDDGFLYLTMFTSFFIGFSTGKFIKKLENKSEKIIDKVCSGE